MPFNFFYLDDNNEIIIKANSRGKIRKPSSKSIASVTKSQDSRFLDFLEKCFTWDPAERLTPDEALLHEWISGYF